MRSMIKAVDRKGKEIKLISAKGNVVDSIAAIEKEVGHRFNYDGSQK